MSNKMMLVALTAMLCNGLGLAWADPSDGPFANKKALVDYWNSTPPGWSATQIFLNGRTVFTRSGGGPAFIQQYFSCKSGDTDINTVCDGDYYVAGKLTTVVDFEPSSATIYFNDTLYRSGDSTRAYITTCHGDLRIDGGGAIQYHMVTGYYDPFVGFFSASCFP